MLSCNQSLWQRKANDKLTNYRYAVDSSGFIGRQNKNTRKEHEIQRFGVRVIFKQEQLRATRTQSGPSGCLGALGGAGWQ